MEINKGFKIDKPDVFVNWDINEIELKTLFREYELKQVTTGYYTTNCSSLNGLNCILGFHFEPRKNGILKELEFFRTDFSNKKKSFDDFQIHFEKSFGKPTNSTRGNEGFNNYVWNFKEVQIVHFVYDRFGPEEHMRIKKSK